MPDLKLVKEDTAASEEETACECGGNCPEDKCQNPEGCQCNEEGTQLGDDLDLSAKDAPDIQQTFMALSSVFLTELIKAQAKYPPYYHSSNEAAGTLTVYHKAVIDILTKIRVVGSESHANDDFNKIATELLSACVKLNVVTVKTIISFCDTGPIAERFNLAMKQAYEMGENVRKETEYPGEPQ